MECEQMKNYNCPTCNKIIPVDRSSIKAGDKVSFCKVTAHSRSARYSSKEGVITERDGDIVSVKYRRESLVFNINDVTPADAPNPLTYAFCGTCECGLPPTQFMWVKLQANNDTEKKEICDLFTNAGLVAEPILTIEAPCILCSDTYGKTFTDFPLTDEDYPNTSIQELRELVASTKAVNS